MAIDINGDGLIAVGGTSTTQGRVRLAEDTDNGTNYVELTANAAITTNRTVTFPDENIDFTTGLSATLGGTGLTSAGTNGNVLTSNGTAWVSQAAAAGGGDYIMQVFTSPGTWTKAAGLKAIKVTVIGGGGGVSGSAPGRTGGTSSFGSPAFLSATGGTSSPVSTGGSGSGGQLNASGGTGGSSPSQCSVTFTISGASAFGFGAATSQQPQAPGVGTSGKAYGGGGVYTGNGAGGGGGAIEYIDAPALPGPQPYTVGAGATGELAAGGSGVVIVEEFY